MHYVRRKKLVDPALSCRHKKRRMEYGKSFLVDSKWGKSRRGESYLMAVKMSSRSPLKPHLERKKVNQKPEAMCIRALDIGTRVELSMHSPADAQDPPVQRSRIFLKPLEAASSLFGCMRCMPSAGFEPAGGYLSNAPTTSSGADCSPSLALRTYAAVAPRKDIDLYSDLIVQAAHSRNPRHGFVEPSRTLLTPPPGHERSGS